MLYRVIYSGETVGSTGASTLSVAQILGVSERNNRRDHLTSCLMFHEGFVLQAIEGGRNDVDRLMRRLVEDRRLQEIKVLVDKPIAARTMADPITLCGDADVMLEAVGQTGFSSVNANDAERIIELRQAA